MKELSRQTKFCTKPSTPLCCQAQTVENTAGTDLLNGRNKGCQLLRILYSTAGCVQPKSQAKSGNHDIYNTAIHGQELSLCPSSKAWRVRLLSAVSSPADCPFLLHQVGWTQLFIGSSLHGTCLSSSKAGTDLVPHQLRSVPDTWNWLPGILRRCRLSSNSPALRVCLF